MYPPMYPQHLPPSLPKKRPLMFKKTSPSKPRSSGQPWKVLIADDEISVHQVTMLALQDFEFAGNGLIFLSAYSAGEAISVISEHRDIALVLLDVVMESDDAGLQVVEYVRHTLGNQAVRIILRTGQPGVAPERQIVTNYDINDYKEKTELTATKLFTAVYAAVRTYRDIRALESNRKGLEAVIEATGTMFRTRRLSGFAQGVLEQLTALLFLEPDAVYCHTDGIAAATDNGGLAIIAATGCYAPHIGEDLSSLDDNLIVAAIMAARIQKGDVHWQDNIYAAYFRTEQGYENIVCVKGANNARLRVTQLILLFLRNVAIALENICLHHDLSREIDERREAERRGAILARLPGELPEPVVRISHTGMVVYANDASQPILRHFGVTVGARLREPWLQRLTRIFKAGERFDTEITQDGRVYEISFSPVTEAFYLNLFGRDVTEYRRLLNRLEHAAFHDPLTGLSNRLYFKKNLEQAVTSAKRYAGRVGLMLIDLDHFKQINDTWGHEAGDKVLKGIADRLRTVPRASDLVARLGGDEFGILVTHFNSQDELRVLAERLLSVVTLPVESENRSWPISCSIGITSYPEDADNADDLQRCADLAMYHAKREGKNTFRFYDGEIHRALRQKTEMELLLHRALKEGLFEIHYQPLVRLDDQALIGSEALLRLQGPDNRLISPAHFIGIAEDTGLIDPIGYQVLEQVCSDLHDWLNRGLPAPKVAINVSGKQFMNRNLPQRIAEILAQYRIPPHLIELEITESVLVGDETTILDILEELRAIGLGLSIDDFGTGFSSLSYLRRLPVSKLKIDRSFTSDMLASADAAAIIDAILSLGNSLRLRVLAEGIEEPAQAEYLRTRGCAEGQGYCFGKPMPKEAFETFIRTRD